MTHEMSGSWNLRIRSGENNLYTESLLAREWLVTNGLGGYASGTILGIDTRRYHSLLTVALPAPLGRQVILIPTQESVRAKDGSPYVLSEWSRQEEKRIFSVTTGLPIGAATR